MSTRINARLDDELARRVAAVQERTKRPLTDIVKDALARYCATELDEEPRPYDAFVAAGFVGCGRGPADLSTRYKDDLRAVLEEKASAGRRRS
jgi:hypothetical protein